MFKTYEVHFTTSQDTENIQIMRCLIVEGESTVDDFEKMIAVRLWGNPKLETEVKLLATLIA